MTPRRPVVGQTPAGGDPMPPDPSRRSVGAHNCGWDEVSGGGAGISDRRETSITGDRHSCSFLNIDSGLTMSVVLLHEDLQVGAYGALTVGIQHQLNQRIMVRLGDRQTPIL